MPTLTPEKSPPESRTKTKWRWAKRMGILLGLTYLGWCAALWLLQEKVIFPAAAAYRAAPILRPGERVLTILTDADEPGYARLILPPGLRPGERVPLAICFHGNAETIETWADEDEVLTLENLGFAVLLPEYRGYGRSPGSPGQDRIISDMVKFYDLALTQPEVDATRVVYSGRSLGGGVACALAQIRKPRALILSSTFKSISAMAWRMGVPGFLVRHPFDSVKVLSTLDVPTFIVHGRADSVVPIAHGRELARIARQADYVEIDAHHVGLPRAMGVSAYGQRVRATLERAGVMPVRFRLDSRADPSR